MNTRCKQDTCQRAEIAAPGPKIIQSIPAIRAKHRTDPQHTPEAYDKARDEVDALSAKVAEHLARMGFES
jgi:predicted translin family RNA/ssDNA-binding protein